MDADRPPTLHYQPATATPRRGTLRLLGDVITLLVALAVTLFFGVTSIGFWISTKLPSAKVGQTRNTVIAAVFFVLFCASLWTVFRAIAQLVPRRE